MKAILLMIWKFLTKKEHLPYTIIVLILLLMGTTIYFQREKIRSLKDKYTSEVNLNNAIHDSVEFYQNKEKEWVAEKATMQTSLSNLEKNYNKLSDSQKELINRIKEVEKKNDVIAAALIKTNVKIDSLRKGTVTVGDSTISFSDSTKNIKYDIEIGYVKPMYTSVKPTLKFNTFVLPNEQFVEFHWRDNKKLGYPVAFSVSNSNEYFKTYDINSYAIPELKKDELNPTGWQKFGKWVTKNGKTIIIVGVAGLAGAGIVLLAQ